MIILKIFFYVDQIIEIFVNHKKQALNLRIIVSGTPGVGKHTISIELSRILDEIPILDINKVILTENLFTSSKL